MDQDIIAMRKLLAQKQLISSVIIFVIAIILIALTWFITYKIK